MQFSTVAIISALAAAVSAAGNYSVNATAAVWVTEVVTQFTTVCPAATVLTYDGATYTVTQNETLTITNCPCTISKPVYTTSSVICKTCTALPTTTPVYGNSTTPAPTATSTRKEGSPTITPAANPSPSTTGIAVANNGNHMMAFSGAGLAGLLGVAAYLL
ncbi:hypothetical protein DSL72_001615 [Monilinia vaccinii-corymbosi]|uniref:Clock-controlled protein 6 n=1 Tax=Monilinia vaccinii-corymbosi TaxID=61207 RepID=A0A8A3P7N1_9HELO|nr:hypothetical protein DSL72_001615 [Monilinia vaccinii-corymbosi]